MKIYNAENQVLGRICSVIAKDLLKGEAVVVVNCEKSVVSGTPKATKVQYLAKKERGDVFHGPFFPRYPDGIFRRTVRGMLPFDMKRGRIAYKNLTVHVGLPEELKNRKMIKVEKFDSNKLPTKFVSLSDLSVSMGAHKRW
ncbi:MAG TPA: 50S ribosomal protein L13 [archaeon]|nr:50S ribosomal protein L13 [archaeon]